jgi:hypothetical protein
MCKLPEHSKALGESTSATFSLPTDLSFIPSNAICQNAYTFASSQLAPTILNHSIRVFLYAKHISTLPLPPQFADFAWSRRSTSNQETLLFIAALFHDVGTADAFDGEDRFEVCGANAATAFMESLEKEHSGMGGSARDEIWTAIACHTSPGIAENIAPLARIIRQAVLCDFNRVDVREEVGTVGMVGEFETGYPRGDIERDLGDRVVEQIGKTKEGGERERKAPGQSWPGGLWRGHIEMKGRGEVGVNIHF